MLLSIVHTVKPDKIAEYKLAASVAPFSDVEPQLT